MHISWINCQCPGIQSKTPRRPICHLGRSQQGDICGKLSPNDLCITPSPDRLTLPGGNTGLRLPAPRQAVPSFPPKRAICSSHYFFLARLTKFRVTHRAPNLVLRRIGPWREKLTDSGTTLSNEHVVSPQRDVGVCRTQNRQ